MASAHSVISLHNTWHWLIKKQLSRATLLWPLMVWDGSKKKKNPQRISLVFNTWITINFHKYLFLCAFLHVDLKSEVRAPPVLYQHPTETDREHEPLLEFHHCKEDRASWAAFRASLSLELVRSREIFSLRTGRVSWDTWSAEGTRGKQWHFWEGQIRQEHLHVCSNQRSSTADGQRAIAGTSRGFNLLNYVTTP